MEELLEVFQRSLDAPGLAVLFNLNFEGEFIVLLGNIQNLHFQGLDCLLCVDRGLSFVFPDAGWEVGAVLVLGVESVAVLALDCQSVVDQVLVGFQSGDCLLQVLLLQLHLHYLLGEVLVGCQQLLVFLLNFLIINFPVWGCHSLIAGLDWEKLCLELVHQLGQHLYLRLQSLSLHVPDLLLLIAHLGVATGACVHLSLEFSDLALEVEFDLLDFVSFLLF